MTPFQTAIQAALELLEYGEVVTYGEIAAQSGYPGAARAVGNVLRNSSGLPWWRVVASDGRLVPGLELEQERRLRAEGIQVIEGRVAESRVGKVRQQEGQS
ncbi:MAG: MGMT family protein [Acidimicrobiia bacterium]|nr:MGMT family protein [Acidimicrobiia bacterium]